MASTVLVTGVTRFLGSSLVGLLAGGGNGPRVIGVDAALPDARARERMGAAEFIRADIRSPLIARVIDEARVDTVVHASTSVTPVAGSQRTLAKEMNVLGTMQLLAACQRSDRVENLIVRSTAAVYGGSPRDPAVFTEDSEPRALPTSGPARDAVDIEGYLRGFIRRRPDVRVAVPRFAEIIGPTVQTPLTRYFSLSPVVPVTLGRDARLQLVHESDAVAVLAALVTGDFAGTVNVAGDGVLTVTQAIHRAGRVPVPVLPNVMGLLGSGLRRLKLSGFSPEQVELLSHGRTLDTTRLREQVGVRLDFTTEEAFADFADRLDHPVRALSSLLGIPRWGARQPNEYPLPAAAVVPGEPSVPTVPRPDRPKLVSIDGGLT
ncbi:NAD-dependent epimerase/dehydratase family protein [Nakamurella sp. A5-74]|uniref:NAD-dependent epimerase/dehydratase family protein n=1 Tax=Nakamurella sp. A5-74 TaxID=3158264 RepID=A0AAU8DRY5_9ACTN